MGTLLCPISKRLATSAMSLKPAQPRLFTPPFRANGFIARRTPTRWQFVVRAVATTIDAKPRPVQIIPSVLPADWANMGACVKDLEEAGVDRIQFDVMDGNFVPNLTFGPDVIQYMRKYCDVKFETQLMVSQKCLDYMLPQFRAATWIQDSPRALSKNVAIVIESLPASSCLP